MPATTNDTARILITGVPGVGKSTAIAALPDDLRNSVVNFGTLILEALSEKVQTRDALRSLPTEELKTAREEVAARLPRRCLIDCHLSITKSGMAVSSTPSKFHEPGFLNGIVILEAKPDVLLERRKGREERVDAPQLMQDIWSQQELNQRFAREIARDAGCGIVIIDANKAPDIVAEKLAAQISKSSP